MLRTTERSDAPAPGGWLRGDPHDELLSFNPESRAPSEHADVIGTNRGTDRSVFAPAAMDGQASPGRARLAGLALLFVVVAAGVYFVERAQSAASVTVTTGDATVDSNPGGAQVIIDGEVRGTTPLKLSLPEGTHTLEVRSGSTVRTLSLPIEAGTLTAQYVELAASGSSGRLEVTSDPPGALVTVDGAQRGYTPLVIEAIGAGSHEVTVASRSGVVTRRVSVEAGATATVMASLAGPNAGGWIGIQAPFELQVFENGQLLGTTASERLMLPAGRHELEVVSTEFQFRAPLSVQIIPGGVASEVVAVPNGSLSVNALPWAEVWIDGTLVGTTPLANLSVAIGPHEIVWRHPNHPERRQTVSVTLGAPARVGVDLTE